MSDLLSWYNAQLDEDERVARRAWPARWMQDGRMNCVQSAETEGEARGWEPEPEAFARNLPIARLHMTLGHFQTEARNARHIARWDPARVLREVKVKRERLGWIKGQLADDPTDESALWLARLDALPYADRPGYREEWAP